MVAIQDIVDVIITAQGVTVSQTGFGSMLILSPSHAFPERVRFYRSMSGVAEDFSPTSAEYKAANLAFGQVQSPDRVGIGRMLIDQNIIVTISNVISNFAYTVRINGTDYTYTSISGDDATAIATGLTAAINGASPKYVNATVVGSTVEVAPNTVGGYGDFGIKVGSNLSIPQYFASVESYSDALDAISSVDSDWYGLMALNRSSNEQTLSFDAEFVADNVINGSINGTPIASVTYATSSAATLANVRQQIANNALVYSATVSLTEANTIDVVARPGVILDLTGFNVTGGASQAGASVNTVQDPASIVEIANWAQSKRKIYVVSSTDPAILTNGANIAKQLHDAALTRTAILYYPYNDGVYPEAAWLGLMLAYNPGSANWRNKNLSGVTYYNLSETQSSNARTVNFANTYERIGGVNQTFDGIMVSGQYIDIQVGIDFLEARIEERVLQAIASTPKIPYTDAGVAIIENIVRAQLNQAVEYNIITDDFVIQTVKVADVSPVDRAARIYRYLDFEAQLVGAINKVIIRGQLLI